MATILGLATAACGGTSSSSDTTSARKRNAALNVGTFTRHKVSKVVDGLAVRSVLTDDGEIYSWGNTDYGRTEVPALHDGAEKFVDIAAADYVTVALDDAGNLYAWGPSAPSLGDIPALPEGADKWTKIWAGASRSVVLQDDNGGITYWGQDYLGSQYRQNPIDPATTNVTGVGFSVDSLYFISADGSVTTVGRDRMQLNEIVRAGNVVSISSNRYFAVVLGTNGEIRTVSRFSYFSNQPFAPTLKEGATKVVSVSSGNRALSAIDDLGNLYSWRTDSRGRIRENPLTMPEVANGGTKFVSTSMGWPDTGAAVDDAGNLYTWGSSPFGTSNVPPYITSKSPIIPISASGNAAFGIEDTGAITEFDSSAPIGTPEGDDYISIANGPRHLLAVTKSGKVVGWGQNESAQLDVPAGLNNVIQVAAGFAYSEALRADGTVVEWGSHVGKNIVPKPDGLSDVKQLVGGFTHVLALKTDGTVVAWGDNKFNNTAVPDGLTDVISVAASDTCNAALKSDGSLTYWGACTEAQTSKTSLTDAKSLAATNNAIAAIMTDGSITAWGDNASGETTIPENVSNVAALVGGSSFFLSVDKSGFVRAWGDINTPQISIPQSFSGIAPVVETATEEQGGGESYVFTDEDTLSLADFIQTLPAAQQKLLLEKLGLTQKKAEADPLATALALKDASKEVVSSIVDQANASVLSQSQGTASTLPPARNPGLAVGTTVTTSAAVTILGLKGVSRVAFVIPKKAGAACLISKTTIKGNAAGSCNVKVTFTDSKKRKRSTTLSLVFG